MKEIEVIAVNDGSTDRSLDIMERFQQEYKDKIKIIDSPNGGPDRLEIKGLILQ